MKIAFLGTPAFALPSLSMLIEEGHELCVFTQPDKPVGRRAELTPPPVKQLALRHGLPVCQPVKIREPEGVNALRAFAPDLMVTAAFGQILSAENLAVPRLGCINVHGSLLPAYRGAAPIQWAVIDGLARTGITTMMTDIGLDTGDILLQEALEILPEETAGELYGRMAELGAKVLQETIRRLQDGALAHTPQDEALATKCRMLKKEDGKLDFAQPAQRLHDRVRGTNPWPGAYALLHGAPLKIWRSRVAANAVPASAVSASAVPENATPGRCFGDAKQGLYIACGEGALEVLELQAPGGKRMEAKAYLRGKPLAGEVLE